MKHPEGKYAWTVKVGEKTVRYTERSPRCF